MILVKKTFFILLAVSFLLSTSLAVKTVLPTFSVDFHAEEPVLYISRDSLVTRKFQETNQSISGDQNYNFPEIPFDFQSRIRIQEESNADRTERIQVITEDKNISCPRASGDTFECNRTVNAGEDAVLSITGAERFFTGNTRITIISSNSVGS